VFRGEMYFELQEQKMKRNILVFTSLLIAVLFIQAANCKNKSGGTDSHYFGEMAADPKLAENNATKLVKVNGLHVAFDFMSMAYHVQMMQHMGADMKYVEGATHGLMVTVMDYDTKKILEDARVAITVTDPAGKVTRHESEIMHGAGMHHYGIHLKAAGAGRYTIIAAIKYKGENIQAKTDFDIK
jgi:hypothetical protein